MNMKTRALAAAISLLTSCPIVLAQGPPIGAGIPTTGAAEAGDPSGFERWASGRYRVTSSDVIELSFPYIPEFNQVLTVQPDGYITLRAVGDVRVQSRTLPELRQLLYDAYAPILREPVITIVLKEFEKPYFIATGAVKEPGKFDLRSATTLTQGLALAGGITPAAKHSQVLLFRRYSEELLEVKEINVQKMFASKDLSEDYLLRPGDTLYVPQNFISRITPFISVASLGLYLNPFSR
jgi:polysaccharide export outer membrane protein